jgi:hypothetical protein
MSEETAAVATQETYEQATKSDSDLVRLWLDALSIASQEEEDWRNNARKAVNLYRQASGESEERVDEKKKFNILHSNIETMLPALYNSTPAPDVRRRYNDDDPAGKTVCDIQERCISYSIDMYDFDNTMRLATFDAEVTGRAVTRIRYRPYVGKDDTLDYEEVQCESVNWEDFRRGPGKVWEDVPWIAFRHYLTREQLETLSPKLGSQVNLDVELPRSGRRDDGTTVPEVFKRATVWEIWDKDRREVLFIAQSMKTEPIRKEADPLELENFFPVPRPVYAIQTSGSLIPVVPYEIYRAQAEELEEVSTRIMALTRAVKARSVYDGRIVGEMEKLERADDADSVPVDNIAVFADGSKLADRVMWMPIDMIVAALEKLYMARDQIKQVIYEVTGISDILRGASEAQETATAQSIKQQWGSLRIQHKQSEIQRYARDLFRMKAELFASKFDPQTLELMTGIPLVPQPGMEPPEQTQQKMQVLQLLKSDKLRGFRIDIESDSTIRADMTRNQNNMNLFLQGTAQFAQAMAPIVMQEPRSLPVVMEVYTAFARNFKLGRQAENALDSMADQAKQVAQEPKANPEMEMKEKELQMKQEESKAKLEADQISNQQKLQFEQQKHEQEMAFKQQTHQADMEMRQYELQANAQDKQVDREMAMQQHSQSMDMEREKMALTAQQSEEDRGLQRDIHNAPPREEADARDVLAVKGVSVAFNDLRKQIDGIAEAVQSTAQSISQVDKKVDALAQEMAAPVEIMRGKDGRAAQVKKGSRTINIKRGPDGRAVGAH